MLASNAPLIVYVPGLLPKPEASHHKRALFRCLTAGIRRIDAAGADDIVAAGRSFDVVSWTFDFYRVHRDINLDSAAIDTVISVPGPSDADIREASSWQRRALRKLYHLVDRFPFLIPHLTNGQMELHLRDLHRYSSNRNNIAEHTREMLKMPLRAAWTANRPILLIGHSMGSVIAYDSLWQMSRDKRDDLSIDLFLTMGSPLGQSYIQKHIMGHADDTMGAVYRETIDDDRLRAVVDHVHEWLFPKSESEAGDSHEAEANEAVADGHQFRVVG